MFTSAIGRHVYDVRRRCDLGGRCRAGYARDRPLYRLYDPAQNSVVVAGWGAAAVVVGGRAQTDPSGARATVRSRPYSPMTATPLSEAPSVAQIAIGLVNRESSAIPSTAGQP